LSHATTWGYYSVQISFRAAEELKLQEYPDIMVTKIAPHYFLFKEVLKNYRSILRYSQYYEVFFEKNSEKNKVFYKTVT